MADDQPQGDDPNRSERGTSARNMLARAKSERDAATVRGGFWRKVRRTFGKVPFLDDALAAYYCAIDSQTPRYVKAVLFGALAYFIVPTDMIPDFIAGLGYGDDATVLLTAIATVRKHISGAHRDAAQAKLAELRDQDGDSEAAGP